jgi:acetolactate synthase-1/2/3 large subunit
VAKARAHDGAVVIDFRVVQEDSVYPMVPTGADLHDMIRRPQAEAAAPPTAAETSHNPIFETGEDE